jgi:hypothetical protein
MPVVAKLFRNTPGPYLREYFERQGIAVGEGIDWDGGNGRAVQR